jgi:hypothetical protein
MRNGDKLRPADSRLRLLPLGVGILLLGLAVNAGLRGIAQTYVMGLELHAGERVAGKVANTERLRDLPFLPRVLGADPDFHYVRADMLLSRHRQLSAGGDTAGRKDGEALLEALRQALRLRPVWARGWARLAYAKASLGQYDADLSQALRQALRLGPHEHEVREMVAWVGLSAWDRLPHATRELVWPVIARAAGDPFLRSDIVRWAVDFGMAAYLEPYLDDVGRRQAEALRKHREALARKQAAGAGQDRPRMALPP